MNEFISNEFISNELILNELQIISKDEIKIKKWVKNEYSRIVFVGDNNPLSFYMFSFITRYLDKTKNEFLELLVVIDDKNQAIFEQIAGDDFARTATSFINNKELLPEGNASKQLVLYFQNPENLNQYSIQRLQYWLDFSKYQNTRIVVTSLLPPIGELPKNVQAVAEKELEYYFRQQTKGSLQYYQAQLENNINNSFNEGVEGLLLRYDNIIGPGVDHCENFGITEMLRSVASNRNVSIDINKSLDRFTFSYVRDAIQALIKMSFGNKFKQIYNVTSYHTNKFMLAAEIKNFYAQTNINFYSGEESMGVNKFHGLDSSKIINQKWKPGVPLIAALKYTVQSFSSEELEFYSRDKNYNGKLQYIKNLELEILDEINRICEKNNINYFLVGGSLLGAVRHKGIIPWDDDIDVGMLREDYELFKKAVINDLKDKFVYQSHKSEGSDYVFDKIRLNETFFDTQFSYKYVKGDHGVFLDILVYDKTSNIKFIQKVHVKLLLIWKRAINIRWVGYPRKNVHYKLSRLLLPIMRLIPIKWYHYVFETLLKIFNNKSNSKYLIDGVGMNLNKGPFSIDWFSCLEKVPFEDKIVPIPSGYHEYLKHWYGENYMMLPPKSKRSSGHNIVQIDIGDYLYSKDKKD